MPFWKRQPKPRSHVPQLDSLLRCWWLSRDYHDWGSPATDEQIDQAEAVIGRKLPRVLRAIYEVSDGSSIEGGNCNIESLMPSDTDTFALTNFTAKLKEYEWAIPDEIIIFGGDGSDGTFGLWLPADQPVGDDCPVIEFGETDVMAVAGSSMVRFLTFRTAYYLMGWEDTGKALDALGVPNELRSEDPDDELTARIGRWANLDIPDPFPDPYDCNVSVEQLREMFGCS